MDVVKVVRPRTLGDLLAFELHPEFCRDTNVLLAGSGAARTVPQFAVVGAVAPSAAQTATGAAKAGNTGNGTIGTVSADAGAPEGDYKVVFIEPATNLGTFNVFRPSGVIDGEGVVGTAYNGTVNFTIADGATDFVSGDEFTVHVAAGQGTVKVVQLNLAGADGSQNAYGVNLFDATTPDAVDGVIQVLRRGPAVVRVEELVWPAGATADQIAHATNQLERLGILARASG